jgi:membrane-associated phospholipid phosphatase
MTVTIPSHGRSKAPTTAGRYYLVAVGALVLLVLNVYAVRIFEIFGSPMLFLCAILLEVGLVCLFVYAVFRALATPESVVRSLVVSLWGGLRSNGYVKRLIHSEAPLVTWARRRLQPHTPRGLPLTTTVLIAAVPLFSFVRLLLDITARGTVVGVDQRLLNLMPKVRSAPETAFFSTVTMLANWQSILVLTAFTVALLWWRQQRPLALIFIAAAAGQEAVTFVVKHVVARMRPDIALSIISEDTYSFPSGHTVRATVLFGLLAYILFRSCRSRAARIATVVLYGLTVSLVALSRVYLGAHYPTDVWAGILLGASMLALLVGFLEITSRYDVIRHRTIQIGNRTLLTAPALLLAFAVLATPLLIHLQTPLTRPTFLTLPTLNESTIHRVPIYSETLTGSRMEPISFLYVGSEAQIVGAFRSHGWDRAEPSTLSNTLRAFAVGFQGGSYPNAPVTPSFLNSQPEDLAFQHATASHSLRQRHHTRLWRSAFNLPDGRPIWVATASFDDGIEFAGAAKVPTHHIDPNIDAERSYIVQSLGEPVHLLVVTKPEAGKNGSGDTFFTDGKAELIYLK